VHRARATHLPPSHEAPPLQSVALAHVVRQAPSRHENGAHELSSLRTHLPRPSHFAAPTRMSPSQRPGIQTRVASAAKPAQLAVFFPSHAGTAHGLSGIGPPQSRPPTGGPVTGEQVPALPITLHAAHG